MTITREQVADLQAGDVVRIAGWYGVTIEGPVQESMGSLWLGQHCRVTSHAGEPAAWMHMDADDATLTVVVRVRRPLYVNHPRTEPVAGDVVRDELGNKMALFICTQEEEQVWWVDAAADWISPAEMREKRLRLLVDGETGQVVP